MMKSTSLYISFAILFAGLGLWFANQNSPPPTIRPEAMQALFATQLPDQSGHLQKISQWQGKPLIINFWASWCPPCVREMPALLALSNELAPKGVQVIGIGVDEADKISNFASEHQIRYPLLIAGLDGAKLSQELGNETGGLPFTIIISANGKIAKSYLGELDFDQLKLDIAHEIK